MRCARGKPRAEWSAVCPRRALAADAKRLRVQPWQRVSRAGEQRRQQQQKRQQLQKWPRLRKAEAAAEVEEEKQSVFGVNIEQPWLS